MIPRRIHQVWMGATDPEPPQAAAEAARSWQRAHPGWSYRLWSGREVEDLFGRVRPDLLELWRGYRHWVQRADAARYLILHQEGGIYADHDMACVRSWEGLREAGAVLAPTRPLGVSNDLMASVPGHPVMAAALDGLPGAARRWDRAWTPPYLRILASTGSLHLTRIHRRTPASDVRLLTAGEYGHGEPEEALVRHLPGSSWHGWDGRALSALGRAWSRLLGGGREAPTP